MAVREVERAVAGRQLTSGQRARFQAAALLARAERANVRNDASLTPAQRDTQLKRLEGLATILAQIATREPSLFTLLQEDAEVSEATRRLEREMQRQAGLEVEEEPEPEQTFSNVVRDRTALPQSVVQAQLANPFLVPDFSQNAPKVHGHLAGWELIEPLLNSFEQAAPGAPACMELPEPRPILLPEGLDLMPHQARVLAAVADGPPDLPAGRRARPRQDRAGAARRAGRRRLPAAGDRAERREDQLGARGADVDAEPLGHRRPR